jgi:hypothetical protein
MVRLRGTLLGSALIGLSSCASPNHAAGDPLLGKPAAAPVAAPAAGSPTAAIPLVSAPAPPSPSGNASTAALASSTAASPDGSYPLKIGGGAPGDGRTWSGPNASTASLQRPEPPGDPVAHGDPQPTRLAPPQTPSAAAPALMTFEQALAQLEAKGVLWKQWTEADGQVKLSCAVPNPQDRSKSRRYEVTSRDYISAAQAALEKITSDAR